MLGRTAWPAAPHRWTGDGWMPGCFTPSSVTLRYLVTNGQCAFKAHEGCMKAEPAAKYIGTSSSSIIFVTLHTHYYKSSNAVKTVWEPHGQISVRKCPWLTHAQVVAIDYVRLVGGSRTVLLQSQSATGAQRIRRRTAPAREARVATAPRCTPPGKAGVQVRGTGPQRRR